MHKLIPLAIALLLTIPITTHKSATNCITIKDSYTIWHPTAMKPIIQSKISNKYNSPNALNRTYKSMYIEWWLHNIGYYITKPFCFIDPIHHINLRCKDVDLEEWR